MRGWRQVHQLKMKKYMLMRLAKHRTFRFALSAMKICLLSGNPTRSVPALQGCKGLW